ncbi:MAG: hypothetical protein NTV20_02300 [Candidatus Shapirobacteria bacterium]|nr:hypothetical protein [Candidatus Shapirobacteria bacterium]
MLKKYLFLSLSAIFLILLSVSSETWAAKARTSRGGSSGVSTGSVFTGGRVITSAKFRGDRRAIIVNFAGLNNATSVSYSLTYNTNGIPQGAIGTMTNISGASDSRELLFGTCSHGVCRYHTGIIDARLVITSKLKSGITTRKSYKLKV